MLTLATRMTVTRASRARTLLCLLLAPAPNRFYRAHRSFYFPRMCNWWISRRLEAAGCPIRAWTVVTASRVMREARGFGEFDLTL